MHTPLFLCLWALFSLLLPLKVEPCRAKVSPKTLSLLTSQPAAQPPSHPLFQLFLFGFFIVQVFLVFYFGISFAFSSVFICSYHSRCQVQHFGAAIGGIFPTVEKREGKWDRE